MSVTEPVHALNLDQAQQQSFVRFYRNLPEKPPSTIRFFNRVDYYTVHGEDSIIASEYTLDIIKYMGEEPKLSYVSVSKSNFEKFLRELLLVRQYRVEVYVRSSGSRNNDWYVEYKGSPGNLTQFEEILFGNTDFTHTSLVMAVKPVRKVLAISSVNVTEARFELCELTDNECFSELEALIAQASPKECIIPLGDSPELISLKNVLDRNGILVARVKKSEFSTDDIIQDLNRLLFFNESQQRNAAAIPETNLTEALGSLAVLISFLNLTGNEKNFNQFKISTIDIHRFVRLDNAALYALNVLPKIAQGTIENASSQENSSRKFSLLGVLDYCCTSQGKRLLEQWIKQPLKDINLINERLDIVECLVKDPETRQILITDSLTKVGDMIMLSKKLLCKKAKLQDCYRVYQIVSAVPHLVNTLKRPGNKSVKAMLTDPIGEVLSDLEKYQSMVETTIDLNLVDRGEFFVKRTFDDELNELYKNKENLEEKMQKLLRKAANDLGFEEGKTIKLECTDQHGYFFRVTLKEEPVLRQNKQYRVIDVIKGGVRFTNSKLTEINEQYNEVKNAYEQQQKTVVSEILEVAAGYADSLRTLNKYIATIDVLVSFATASVSARIPYVRPSIHKEDSGMLKLRRARHPCLEKQDSVAFIPNDAEFDRNNKMLHIITGPNMCGKSTYIRSVGVCVLMTHIGCLVPCDEADITVIDALLARVGADDCQLKGLSTFMLEMVETSSIIKCATSNSLVIIDELGRGTSTYDGCGIAWSIVEYLAKEVQCFTLFATHFHEITQLSEMFPLISNLHVTAVTTNDSITPLYQIKEGPCDKSYGIHCARTVGFPEDVIQWASEYQKQLEHCEGLRYIEAYDNSLKRKVIEEGDKIINDTISELNLMNVNNMTDAEIENYLKKLKTQLVNSDNQFIKGLILE